MKIIIAPTKKMVVNTDDFDVLSQPQYLDDAQAILQVLKQLTYEQAKEMWHCSDKLARENFAWLHEMSLTQHQTPAILGYTGIQYQYMAPDLFTAPALNYIQANLRILTGFYGILRPFDGVVPYRLEMQSAVAVNQTANLYQFWGDRLHAALQANDGLILNLASQEYAKAITPYLTPDEHMVDIVFASLVNGKPKIKATFAKMARGEMVRYLAENQISDLADVAKFDHPDWHFDADRSTANQLVFIDNGHHH